MKYNHNNIENWDSSTKRDQAVWMNDVKYRAISTSKWPISCYISLWFSISVIGYSFLPLLLLFTVGNGFTTDLVSLTFFEWLSSFGEHSGHFALSWVALLCALLMCSFVCLLASLENVTTIFILALAVVCVAIVDVFFDCQVSLLHGQLTDKLFNIAWTIGKIHALSIIIVASIIIKWQLYARRQWLIVLLYALLATYIGFILQQRYLTSTRAIADAEAGTAVLNIVIELAPVIMCVIGGVLLINFVRERKRSFFVQSVLLFLFPIFSAQLHIAFGSVVSYHQHHVIAKILTATAFVIPLIGAFLEVIFKMQIFKKMLADKNKENIHLWQSNKKLQRSKSQLNSICQSVKECQKSEAGLLVNLGLEMKEPVNNIMAMTSLLQANKLEELEKLSVKAIYSASEKLYRLASEVTDYGKIKSGQININYIEFDFYQVIEMVADQLTYRINEQPVSVSIVYADDIPGPVKGDFKRIQQVIYNLAIALHSLRKHREICINTQLISQQIDSVTLLVKFCSPKQAKEDMKCIGMQMTNLYLAVASELVKQLHGELTETKDGEVAVRFSLPLAPGVPIKVRNKVDLQGVRVLIVDDVTENCELLERLLNRWGMVCDIARTATEALEKITQQALGKHPYDIALLDYKMPAMDGEMLGRGIKNDPVIAKTKLVMLTTADYQRNIEDLKRAGFSGYLLKPARSRLLLQLLGKVLLSEPDVLVTREMLNDGSETVLINSGHQPGNINILVAEDSYSHQLVIKTLLKKLGCNVTAVDCKEQLIQQARQFNYDIIMLDMLLKSKSTVPMVDELKRLFSQDVPVVGLVPSDRQQELIVNNELYDDIIYKPYSQNVLVNILNHWCSEKFSTIQ
ncbi:response regulator [Zooshikella ganghwensis]|uniref:Response regulator n=2 Tax=Zooshikella ganghwensis TaxID=202772 RepID=A0A4P9VJL1_9GAMM|nr:response regulator [Zooshikella ganghwensis]